MVKGHAVRVGCRGRQGTGFTPGYPCSHARDVALLRAQLVPICTSELMLHSPRVIAVALILRPPTRPLVMLWPASRPGPGRTVSVSRRM